MTKISSTSNPVTSFFIELSSFDKKFNQTKSGIKTYKIKKKRGIQYPANSLKSFSVSGTLVPASENLIKQNHLTCINQGKTG